MAKKAGRNVCAILRGRKKGIFSHMSPQGVRRLSGMNALQSKLMDVIGSSLEKIGAAEPAIFVRQAGRQTEK